MKLREIIYSRTQSHRTMRLNEIEPATPLNVISCLQEKEWKYSNVVVSKPFDISSHATSRILIPNEIGETSEGCITSNELLFFMIDLNCLCLLVEPATPLNVISCLQEKEWKYSNVVVSKPFDISSHAISRILIPNEIGETSEGCITSRRVMEPTATCTNISNELLFFMIDLNCLCLLVEPATPLNVISCLHEKEWKYSNILS